MRINSINANQCFKAKLTLRVEEGFRKLGNAVEAGYGEKSPEMARYMKGIDSIKSTCPDATIDIKDYYEKTVAHGTMFAPTVITNNHYYAYVMKTKYLPDVVIKKVENTEDLFSLKTFEDVATAVSLNKTVLTNGIAPDKNKYMPDRETQTQELKSKNEQLAEILKTEYKDEYMYKYDKADDEIVQSLKKLHDIII